MIIFGLSQEKRTVVFVLLPLQLKVLGQPAMAGGSPLHTPVMATWDHCTDPVQINFTCTVAMRGTSLCWTVHPRPPGHGRRHTGCPTQACPLLAAVLSPSGSAGGQWLT